MTSAPARSHLRFRPARERFHSRLEWLESWHSFSFAGHHDPAWMGFGPLRVINDDTIAPGRGFAMHPHCDMEIITVMVEGQLNHRDDMGHAEVLRAGEVQRMSAGTGVVHSEINEGAVPCRFLQIWIEPSSAGIAPAYEQRAYPRSPGWTPLLDPERRDGAMAIHRPVHLWRARPAPWERLPLPIPSGPLGWIQMIEGGGHGLGGAEGESLPLQRGDGLGFRAGSSGVPQRFQAGPGGADLLLFALA